MRLGIIGFPQSGKTTIFNAFTRGDQPTITNGGRLKVQTSVVDVPDLRVEKLVELLHTKKTTYAKVTYTDITGLDGNNGANGSNGRGKTKGGMTGELLNQLSQMDGFIHAVRCFENASIPHPMGSVNPQRDIAAMDAELLLNDLISVENKIERLEEERRRSGGRDNNLVARDLALFEQL